MPRGRKPKYTYSEEEQKILTKLQAKSNVKLMGGIKMGLAGEVEYHQRHNHMIAIVPTKKGILVGVAKRNPNDAFNEQAGKNIAFKRAIQVNGGYSA